MDNYNIWKMEGKSGVEKHGIKHTHSNYWEVYNKKKQQKSLCTSLAVNVRWIILLKI